jgi:VanZ like family
VAHRFWRTATLGWLAGILVISLLPGGSATPGGTFWHLFGYGVLGAVWGRWQAFWPVWLLGTAYGAAIEGLQYLVPYRRAEVADLVVNAAGVLLGLVVARLWLRRPNLR